MQKYALIKFVFLFFKHTFMEHVFCIHLAHIVWSTGKNMQMHRNSSPNYNILYEFIINLL